MSASEGLNAVFTHRGERQAVDTFLDAYNIVDLSYAKTFGEGNLTARFWVSNPFGMPNMWRSLISPPKEETLTLA